MTITSDRQQPILHETLTLPGNKKIAVTLNPQAFAYQNVVAVFDNEDIRKAIDETAKASCPMLHWRHGNDVIDSKTAAKVVQAFLDNGDIGDAEGIIDVTTQEGRTKTVFRRVRRQKIFHFASNATIDAFPWSHQSTKTTCFG